MLHQMHVELVETKKRYEERRANKKPFIYKEIDFPSISGDRNRERKTAPGNTFSHLITSVIPDQLYIFFSYFSYTVKFHNSINAL